MKNNNKKLSHSFKKHIQLPPNTTHVTMDTTTTYTPYCNKRKDDIFKVATLNINWLSSIKRQPLIDIMNEKQIQILGLSEVRINNLERKYAFAHEDKYQFLT